MMFQKKIDRAMDWLKEKNKTEKSYNIKGYKRSHGEDNATEYYDARSEWIEKESEALELEKNDVLAIIISAIIVFGPVFLIMIIVGTLVFYSI